MVTRHNKKDSDLNYLKYPLESKGKNGKTIFMYLRKSTKKKSQEESMETQNKQVLKLAKKLGYNEKEIVKFEDPGCSGYREVKTKDGKITKRPRKGFENLLKAIDDSKEPCILLVNNYSRLARNADDGGVIIERLGYKGNTQKIEAIHFCIGGDTWDRSTRKTYMQDCFNQAEEESEVKSEYMRANIEDHLDKKIFPPMTPTPPGLKATRYGLEETQIIDYIREAMKMRIAKKTLKEIEKYLKLYGIRTSLANITKTIFENPIYIGEYTDKKTGLFVPDLVFTKGRPPVDRALFLDLQKAIGKKAGGYGEKQRGDIIAPLLRWEQDEERRFSFSVETPKGRYKSYKSGAFDGFNKSEIKIVKEFLEQAIPKIMNLYFSFYQKKREENDRKIISEFHGLKQREFTERTVKEIEIAEEELRKMEKENIRIANAMTLYADGYNLDELLKMTCEELIEEEKEWSERLKSYSEKDLEKRRKNMFILQHTSAYKELEATFNEGFHNYWKKYSETYDTETSDFLNSISAMDKGRIEALGYGKEKIIQLIKNSNSEKLDKASSIKQHELEILQEKHKELAEEKDGIYLKYADLGYPIALADKKVSSIDNELASINARIIELGECNDVEQFLERLPEVLGKTFELASKAISNEDISILRDEIMQLIELVTFELQISTKKELQVKLFKGLDEKDLLSGAPDKNRTCV